VIGETIGHMLPTPLALVRRVGQQVGVT